MRKRTKKASRMRMQRRLKKRSEQAPGVRIDTLTGATVPNRARGRADFAWHRGAPGRSARQILRNKRKQRIQAARMNLRKEQSRSRQIARSA